MMREVHEAVREALKSAETFRLGAVVVAPGRRIVSRGHNRNLNSCGLWSVHAEMDALWKCRDARDVHLVVARVLRDGSTALSRPCAACARAISRRGVARVTYTTGDADAPLLTMRV